ncbi:hypothetical protein SFUMM280S_05037 [Streptomyces fumanus]
MASSRKRSTRTGQGGADLGGLGDVGLQAGLVVDDLHAASAEDVGAHQDRVADLVGDGLGPGERGRGAVLGGGQARLGQHPPERAAVLGRVDGLRRGADDRHPVVLQRLGETERGLPAELDDDARDRAGLPLGVHHLQDVLQGERLEVEPVGGVVVGGDGLRVAVDHHGLVPGVAQREGGVHAGVVELDALADPVGSGAQDDHRGLLARGDLALLVVGGVEVRRLRGELGGAGVDRLVDRADAERVPHLADHVLAQAADLGDLLVGEAVPLGLGEQLAGELGGLAELVGDLLDEEELVDEPGGDLRVLEDLLRGGARADGPHHGVDPAVGRAVRHSAQRGLLVARVAGERELAALLLQRAQRLGRTPRECRPIAMASLTGFMLVPRVESATGTSRRRSGAPRDDCVSRVSSEAGVVGGTSPETRQPRRRRRVGGVSAIATPVALEGGPSVSCGTRGCTS